MIEFIVAFLMATFPGCAAEDTPEWCVWNDGTGDVVLNTPNEEVYFTFDVGN